MKQFQRANALFLALALIASLFSGIVLSVEASLTEDLNLELPFLHAAFAATPPVTDGVVDEMYHCDLSVGSVKFGAAWDKNNLYLVFTDTTTPTVTNLKINDVDVTEPWISGGNAREIKIPLAAQNISDYRRSYAMSVVVNDQVWAGYLILDTLRYSSNPAPKSVNFGAEISADGWSCILNSFASSDSKYAESDQKHRDVYYPTMDNLVASLSQDTVIEFDLTVTYLPEIQKIPSSTTSGSRAPLAGGFNIAMHDGEDKNIASNGYSKEGLWSGLYQKNGMLYFVYWDGSQENKYVSTTVGDYVTGGQYHLRIEYSYDENTAPSTETNNTQNDKVSAKYYINGRLIATSSDAKRMDSNYASSLRKIIFLTAQGIGSNDSATENTRAEVTVSKLYVSKADPKVYDDIEAACQAEALIHAIGTVGLERESAIQAARKAYTSLSELVRPQVTNLAVLEAAELELTRLKAGGSPAFVDAAFTASPITIDGKINKSESWRMSGTVLSNKGALVAEYGFQWNQTTLFVAIDFTGTEQAVGLTLNGKSFTVSGTKLYQGSTQITSAKVAKSNSVVEISIPMQALGLGSKVSEYGKTMDATVKAGSYAGFIRKLTLSGIDWSVALNRNNKPSVTILGLVGNDAQNESHHDESHGVRELENGYRLFDLYGTSNLAQIRSCVGFHDRASLTDRIYDMRLEFDFQAHALPVLPTDGTAYSHTGGAYACSGFTCCAGELRDATNYSLSFAYGIINTVDGLMFVLNVGSNVHTQVLHRELGQKFSIAVEWTKENTLKLFVDGVHINTFNCIGHPTTSASNASLVINMRPMLEPKSAKDNYDVSVTNIAIGNVHRKSGILAQINFEDICGENQSNIGIISDLVLPTSITNGQFEETYPITWRSSQPSIVSNSGKVTRPTNGMQKVTLTATLTTGETKNYDLIVYGTQVENDSVLHVIKDTNPAKGVGIAYSEMGFTFDATNNSIIKDLANKQKVNFVVLKDMDDQADLTPETMTLWVSNNNKTYTRIQDYKLLHAGEKWYLYGFEAEGRYIKVHYTKPDEGEFSTFFGTYGDMIDAGYETVFGGGNATFSQTKYTLTNNTGSDKSDYAWTISKKSLGVTGTDASIRIYADGKLQYHYVSGSDVVVRINDLAAGASVELTILSSTNTNVMDIANKEGVHEVIYGVQNTTLSTVRWYYMTLPAGTTFPDGSKLTKETIFAMGRSSKSINEETGEVKIVSRFRTSTDGGKTWVNGGSIIDNAPAGKTPVEKVNEGGWMFDSKTGRLMYETYVSQALPGNESFCKSDMEVSHMHTIVIISDDGGKTWYQQAVLPCRSCMDAYKGDLNYPTYALSYSDGTELSTNDGKGPNVDFVFPLGVQYDNIGTFACRIAYTKDGGETWNYSETPITYPSLYGSEGGCSEGWIIEREDGVLVLHVRAQDMSSYHFKVSYSYDHGLTWTNEYIFTDYYAVNGQAFIRKMEIAGENTVISAWGGNTSLGNATYHRNPFVFASSANDGETFRNIQNIIFRSFEETYENVYISNTTNVSLVSHSGDDLLFTYRRNRLGDWVITNVEDFDNWFTRTKGAYDDFEHGVLRADGWNRVIGHVTLASEVARGKYAMKLDDESMAIRSIPYLQDGKLSIDIYVSEGGSFTLELQSAHTRHYDRISVPIALRVENGKLYFNSSSSASGEVKNGWNTFTFDLGLSKDEASLCINGGAAIDVPLKENFDDYICFINIASQKNSTIYVDEFLVIDMLEADLSVDNMDKLAAEQVIELIKAIKNPGDRAAVVAARTAFDQMTQTQQDLVNRRVLANNGESGLAGMINYYELLRMYEDDVIIVEYLISAIGTVTLESEAAINSAENAYAQLTDGQKAQISNYATLTAARVKLNQLKQDKIAADKAAAKAVDNLIAALPPVGQLALTDRGIVETAREAYENLTGDQKQYVEILSVLEAAEAEIQRLQSIADKAAAKTVDDLIAALPPIGVLTLDNRSAVQAAREAYDLLTADEAQYITNLALLEAAEAEIELLQIWNYSVIGNEIRINHYLGTETDLTIPESLHDLPVTVIGASAFSGCTNLTTVIIPDGISKIDNGAFLGCDNLQVVLHRNSQAAWDQIVIGDNNTNLINAVIVHDFTGNSLADVTFTVVFENWDGSILSASTCHWGDAVTPPATPVKSADNTYTYTFTGWDKEVATCRGNTIYTAIFEPTYIDYTVIFQNWDGTVLSTNTYHYGDPVTAPSAPTRPNDSRYSYTFTGWDKEIASCQGNATYTAVYSPKSLIPSTITSPKYTVKGDILSKVGCGTSAEALLGNLGEGAFAKVYQGNQVVAKDALVGTGMSVKITDGNTVKASATIVVTGDVNGDGAITISDMLAVKAQLLNKKALTGAYALAADTNGSSDISITDFLQLKAHILGKIKVEPKSVVIKAAV